MPALNNNTQYCHCVDRDDSDNLIVPGSVTAASVVATALTVTALNGGPIEVAESGADAADLWTALAALGLIVEPS